MVRTQDAGNKVLNIFNRLKRRANQSPSTFESGQVTPLQNLDPNLNELGESAMNSYRLRSEVVKTEGGFEVV